MDFQMREVEALLDCRLLLTPRLLESFQNHFAEFLPRCVEAEHAFDAGDPDPGTASAVLQLVAGAPDRYLEVESGGAITGTSLMWQNVRRFWKRRLVGPLRREMGDEKEDACAAGGWGAWGGCHVLQVWIGMAPCEVRAGLGQGEWAADDEDGFMEEPEHLSCAEQALFGEVFERFVLEAEAWLQAQTAPSPPPKLLSILRLSGSTKRRSLTHSAFSQNLAQFRAGAADTSSLQVLVATSILHEGIDVPACSLVIRADPPATPLDNVQSRGRARASGSRYIHLVRSENGRADPAHTAQLRGFITFEQCFYFILDRRIRSRDHQEAIGRRLSSPSSTTGGAKAGAEARAQPAMRATDEGAGSSTERKDGDSFRGPAAMPACGGEEMLRVVRTGAGLPLESAVTFLHNTVYAVFTGGDERCRLDLARPPFRKRHFRLLEDEGVRGTQYQYEVRLPPVGCCAVLITGERVTGPKVACKQEAKDKAALLACRRLFEMGVLDNFLHVAGRAAFHEVMKEAKSARRCADGLRERRRSDKDAALKVVDRVVRPLPSCLTSQQQHAAQTLPLGTPPPSDAAQTLPLGTPPPSDAAPSPPAVRSQRLDNDGGERGGQNVGSDVPSSSADPLRHALTPHLLQIGEDVACRLVLLLPARLVPAPVDLQVLVSALWGDEDGRSLLACRVWETLPGGSCDPPLDASEAALVRVWTRHSLRLAHGPCRALAHLARADPAMPAIRLWGLRGGYVVDPPGDPPGTERAALPSAALSPGKAGLQSLSPAAPAGGGHTVTAPTPSAVAPALHPDTNGEDDKGRVGNAEEVDSYEAAVLIAPATLEGRVDMAKVRRDLAVMETAMQSGAPPRPSPTGERGQNADPLATLPARIPRGEPSMPSHRPHLSGHAPATPDAQHGSASCSPPACAAMNEARELVEARFPLLFARDRCAGALACGSLRASLPTAHTEGGAGPPCYGMASRVLLHDDPFNLSTPRRRKCYRAARTVTLSAGRCEVLPLTCGEFIAAQCLPSVLWRLEMVAGVEERARARVPGLGGVSLSRLCTALTHHAARALPVQLPAAAATQPQLDTYEVLEFLGDAVLKFMCVARAFWEMPGANEGEITRSVQLPQSNRHLMARSRWAVRRAAASPEASRQSNALRSALRVEFEWRLPELLLARHFDKRLQLRELRRQEVTGKQQADVVEALLGAVFVHARGEGVPGALQGGLQGGVEACAPFFHAVICRGAEEHLGATEAMTSPVTSGTDTAAAILFSSGDQQRSDAAVPAPPEFPAFGPSPPGGAGGGPGSAACSGASVVSAAGGEVVFTAAEREMAAALRHSFRDPGLLRSALSFPGKEAGGEARRSSRLGERCALQAHVKERQRLELLGDAVLQVLVSDHLVKSCPHLDEGELSDARMHLVCTHHLACKMARHLLARGAGSREDVGETRAGWTADAEHVTVAGQCVPPRTGGDGRTMPLQRSQLLPSSFFGGLQAVNSFVQHVAEQSAEQDLRMPQDMEAAAQEASVEMLLQKVAAPKCMADTYEAMVGAVFVDSGSLDAVWALFEADFHVDECVMRVLVAGWREQMQARAKLMLAAGAAAVPGRQQQKVLAEEPPSDHGKRRTEGDCARGPHATSPASLLPMPPLTSPASEPPLRATEGKLENRVFESEVGVDESAVSTLNAMQQKGKIDLVFKAPSIQQHENFTHFVQHVSVHVLPDGERGKFSGEGRNKREAKRKAAEIAVNWLESVAASSLSLANKPKAHRVEGQGSTRGGSISSSDNNHVSALNTMHQKRLIDLHFTEALVESDKMVTQFGMQVAVEELVQSGERKQFYGQGATKKEAKRNASEQALKWLEPRQRDTSG
ncbi:hypothetical protein CYMTET_56974 [Cymbomonas tetramitiformis]|uniref:Uncharacterized protein n=1 Tax=Cymbomonas tetramitiformis TaxID=36881 RepID=A0AAE0B9U5_9CHLO|nr:hypothetical protein CYMTET_56974 [Cymbomonas tetramitiformis]